MSYIIKKVIIDDSYYVSGEYPVTDTGNIIITKFIEKARIFTTKMEATIFVSGVVMNTARKETDFQIVPQDEEFNTMTEQEGLMEEHERQMNDDDSRGFSNDDTPPRMYEDDESQAIYEAEKRMGA